MWWAGQVGGRGTLEYCRSVVVEAGVVVHLMGESRMGQGVGQWEESSVA